MRSFFLVCLLGLATLVLVPSAATAHEARAHHCAACMAEVMQVADPHSVACSHGVQCSLQALVAASLRLASPSAASDTHDLAPASQARHLSPDIALPPPRA